MWLDEIAGALRRCSYARGFPGRPRPTPFGRGTQAPLPSVGSHKRSPPVVTGGLLVHLYPAFGILRHGPRGPMGDFASLSLAALRFSDPFALPTDQVYRAPGLT